MILRKKIFIALLLLPIVFSSEINLFRLIANDRKNNISEQVLAKVTSPIIVLKNALNPTACLDDKGGIICSGVYWRDSYPLVAQKIDSTGNLLWPNVPYGIPISHPIEKGNATMKSPIILPKKDGGAYFAYEYWKYLGREDLAKLYFFRPVLQSVDTGGDILWGDNGKNLTNMRVRYHGGANILGMRYDNKGNIMIIWSWIDMDSIALPNIEATYLQKVNPITGDILSDSAGIKLLDERAGLALFGKFGNTYLFHCPYVMCIDQSGKILWDYELMDGFPKPNYHYRVATNDKGDIFIIYEDIDGIHCRIFASNGEPVLQDTLIISGGSGLFFNTPVANWDNDKWVFPIYNHIYCVDRDGISLWGSEGIAIPDTNFGIMKDMLPVDANNLLVLYRSFGFNIQKIDIAGEILWGDTGIVVLENAPGTVAHLLPNSEGGAFIIMEGMSVYEPEFRPRGTYIEKVDKDGNLGFMTSVEEKYDDSILTHLNWVSNYPNPFHDNTTITIKTNLKDTYLIVIYNLQGREVKRYYLRNSTTKVMSVQWDGKDKYGSEVAEGVYFYRVSSNNRLLAAGKMIYLKNF